MSVTILDLVRHGRTPEKDEKHDHDENLSTEGYKEARMIAEYFKNTPLLEILYSSFYRRANATATTVKNTLHRKKYIVTNDSLLNEISRPLADGRHYSDKILQKYFEWRKDIIFNPNEENIHSRFMNRGESYWKFHQRGGGEVLQAFTHPQFANQEIAIFTHSQLIVTLKTWIKYGAQPTPHQLMDPFRDRDHFPPYGSITKVKFCSETNKWTIVEENFVDHLQ